jgi:hypothetical protein
MKIRRFAVRKRNKRLRKLILLLYLLLYVIFQIFLIFNILMSSYKPCITKESGILYSCTSLPVFLNYAAISFHAKVVKSVLE